MTRVALSLVVLLAACASPSPRFAGARAGAVEVDGMRFTIYRRADEVEVHRSGGGIPRQRDVLLAAIRAVRTVTGCPVRPRSLKGDQAVMTAEIDCRP